MRLTSSLRASSRSPLLQVLKTSLASVGAWVVCVVLLNQPLPIFAAIAALLVVQPSVNLSL
ncbi:MAG TPA: FUSC family protein, partial [Terrimesophilobacter sp.]|nr:FUSC family protein [Terrimesophilobacter sp.]